MSRTPSTRTTLFGLAFVLTLLALTGCSAVQTLIAGSTQARLLAQIDEAESRWQAQALDSYTITVRTVSAWHMQVDTLTVQNGVVIGHEASCGRSLLDSAETCEVQPVEDEEFTVEGLFRLARAMVDTATRSELGASMMEGLRFEFDAVYSYPTRIVSSPVGVYDADVAWIVEAFEPLP